MGPILLHGGSPPLENVLKVAHALVNQLPYDEQKGAAPLLNWCMAACVRLGNGNVQNKKSQLDVKWETPATATDRRVLKWVSQILQPFRSERVAPVQQPMIPATHGNCHSTIAQTEGNQDFYASGASAHQASMRTRACGL